MGIAKIREIAKIMRKWILRAQYKIRSHRNHRNHRKDIALQYQEFVEFVVEKDRVTEEHLISVKSVQSVVEKKDLCGLCVIKESGESRWWEEAK